MLAMDRPEPAGLWVAQDTGGAIKGPNRFDTFWGAGARARNIAGGMSARGQSVILVPKGTFARLKAQSEQSRAGQSAAALQQ
jgi:membrane-bound lytic murein transglycosylase A